MTLQNGVDAPDFTLKTNTPDGLEDVCLSEHKGQQNVVLLFFHSPSPVFAQKKLVRYETTCRRTMIWTEKSMALA